MDRAYWLDRLQESLRSVDDIAPDHEFEFHDQGDDFDFFIFDKENPPRRAAVLVPLVWRGDILKVILTLRTDNLPSHAGQIAFPGGTKDENDVDLVRTALREAHEEIGLNQGYATILGVCDNYYTRSNYLITPVVALIDEKANFSPNDDEVAKIFELPFEFLIDPAEQKVHTKVFQGIERHYRAIECEGYYVWGVTASLFKSLSSRLVK